jgi:hypothetical protein
MSFLPSDFGELPIVDSMKEQSHSEESTACGSTIASDKA